VTTPAIMAKLESWNISETDYPTGGSVGEQLEFALHYAVLAPSSHNTQPWLFKVEDTAIEVYADRARALPVCDPDDRELVISCGTAVFHTRIALRHFGHGDVLEILPKNHDADFLARIARGDPYEATPEEQKLFRAIQKRRTNRSGFEDRKVPDGLLVDLQQAARVEGATLHVVRGENRRNAVVDLVAEGDRTQMAQKSFRRELAAWVRSNRSTQQDGIPGYGFGFTDIVSVGGPFVIRTFDLGGFQAAKDRELAAGSPVIAVLHTEADNPRDWIAAGQALARVLLRARADGVWASFLNQPIEVEELRPKLRDAVDITGFPQILLRMGYGPEVRPTPRRGLRDVMIGE
jgi:nitroreductase